MINDFDVIAQMIRDANPNVRTTNHLVSATTAKLGGHITMGVPRDELMKVFTNDDERVILLIVNGNAFEETKLRMVDHRTSSDKVLP